MSTEIFTRSIKEPTVSPEIGDCSHCPTRGVFRAKSEKEWFSEVAIIITWLWVIPIVVNQSSGPLTPDPIAHGVSAPGDGCYGCLGLGPIKLGFGPVNGFRVYQSLKTLVSRVLGNGTELPSGYCCLSHDVRW